MFAGIVSDTGRIMNIEKKGDLLLRMKKERFAGYLLKVMIKMAKLKELSLSKYKALHILDTISL